MEKEQSYKTFTVPAKLNGTNKNNLAQCVIFYAWTQWELNISCRENVWILFYIASDSCVVCLPFAYPMTKILVTLVYCGREQLNMGNLSLSLSLSTLFSSLSWNLNTISLRLVSYCHRDYLLELIFDWLYTLRPHFLTGATYVCLDMSWTKRDL